jgi:hypothetical protein
MSKQKIYHQAQTKKGEYFVIFWDKGKYTMKQHQELTVQIKTTSHSYDINDFDRYSLESISKAYIQNITWGDRWYTDTKFMEEFRQILTPIIEEFKKDVEYRYSLDGWIGRIFIEPVEKFIEWLKK